MNTKKNSREECDPGGEKKNLVRLLAGSKLEMSAVLVVRELRGRDLSPEIGGEECVCFGNLCAKQSIRISGIREERSELGVRTATKVAFKKLPIVAVEPLDWV